MSLDEALLACAGPPSLRLYRWQPVAVSLGCFQEHDPIAAALPAGLPLVRRITGGGAIWHEHEVTYALTGRLGEGGWPTRMEDAYRLLHGAIAAALRTAGVPAQGQERSTGDRRYRSEPRCFASPAADDVVAPDGGKILGSAGRVRAGRVLVHGSLKLASNPWDGAAVTGCGLPWDDAGRLLADALAGALGQDLELGVLNDDERQAQARIRSGRYGSDAWVRRREGERW